MYGTYEMTPTTLITTVLAWGAVVARTDAAVVPHIILSVADDHGWNQVGFHNPEFRTPTIDALRAEGIELTRHYTYMCA